MHGLISVDFPPSEATINTLHYANLLKNKVRRAIRKNNPQLSKQAISL